MNSRRLCYTLCAWLFLGSVAHASAVFTTFGDFLTGLRNLTKTSSTTALPTAALVEFANESIVWTSTDIGGVEYVYQFDTDTNVAFYAIPDSVTEVIFATLLSGNITKSIKAWNPEYFEDYFNLQQLNGTTNDETPKGYNVWADTIQLMPAPTKVDSIYLKCYIQHPSITDSADTIQLKPAFTEAAMYYAAAKIKESLGLFDEATYYMNRYTALKQSLLIKYRPKSGLKMEADASK